MTAKAMMMTAAGANAIVPHSSPPQVPTEIVKAAVAMAMLMFFFIAWLRFIGAFR